MALATCLPALPEGFPWSLAEMVSRTFNKPHVLLASSVLSSVALSSCWRFPPKVVGLTLAIPGPIFAVYLIVHLAPLFVEGMRTIMQDELDYRKGLLVAISIAVGVGFQFKLVSLPIGGLWGPILQQGLTAGGITVILLTLFMEITGQGRRRINTELSVEALPKINKFLADFSSSRGWNAEMTERLHAVGEETLLILVNQYEDGDAHDQRRLLILAASDGLTAEMEFATAPGDAENLVLQLQIKDVE